MLWLKIIISPYLKYNSFFEKKYKKTIKNPSIRTKILARITGLFSGKSYNLNSLTAGPPEDPSIYRVIIGLTGDDRTFEQIKKQLNRSVEVIKVMDLTGIPVHLKELMFLRVSGCSQQDMTELFRLSQVLGTLVIDYGPSAVLLQSVQQSVKMTIW